GAGLDSIGAPQKMTYFRSTSHGRGWDGSSTFTAPVAGQYYFSISGVRTTDVNHHTTNDVYILLRRGAADVGFAWSGHNSGHPNPTFWRDSLSFCTVLNLAAGEEITTWVAEPQNGARRRLEKFEFTGILLNEGTDLAVQGNAGHA